MLKKYFIEHGKREQDKVGSYQAPTPQKTGDQGTPIAGLITYLSGKTLSS